MTTTTHFRSALWAFILAVCLLLMMVGCLQVEAVTHRTLHGNTATFSAAAVYTHVAQTAGEAERYVPARAGVLLRLWKTEAAWLARLLP